MIVWAIDGSALSDAAYPYVRAMCERYGSSLCLVYVLRPLVAREEEHQVLKLKARTIALRRHGINASLHVLRGALGSPARHVADVARMRDADLIIVTTRGRAPAAGALAGSVSQQLVGAASCPVLVLPATIAPATELSPAWMPRPAAGSQRVA